MLAQVRYNCAHACRASMAVVNTRELTKVVFAAFEIVHDDNVIDGELYFSLHRGPCVSLASELGEKRQRLGALHYWVHKSQELQV